MKAILVGMAKTEEAQRFVSNMVEEEYDTSLCMSIQSVDSTMGKATHVPEGVLPVQGGGKVKIRYDPCQFKEVYLDEYTRESLPHHLVRAAIRDELDYVNKTVWELSDAQTIMSNAENTVIRTRWVISNKGDEHAPGIRARLVAQEASTYKSD